MQRTPTPTVPGQPASLYPDLTNYQPSPPVVPLHSTVNNVQQAAATGICPILLPQPTPPSRAYTKGFPIVHTTSAQPLPPPQYPTVVPGPTTHHYKQVPPPPFPTVQKAPANPPVVQLYEAPQTRGSSFPAVQRAPAQQPKAPPPGTVLYEAPKDRYFH